MFHFELPFSAEAKFHKNFAITIFWVFKKNGHSKTNTIVREIFNENNWNYSSLTRTDILIDMIAYFTDFMELF